MRQRFSHSIGFSLGLLLACFGLVAMGIVGYTSYASSRDTLLKAAQRDLLTATQVLGRNFQTSVNDISADSLLLASLSGSLSILQDSAGAEEKKAQLAEILTKMLAVHPEYVQIRLIGAAHHALEQVRVDRDGDILSRVIGQDLQEKSHYSYVFETLHLERGQVHLSDITLNHEQGAHSGLGKPTVRVASPVVSANGTVMGLIVINLDLNLLFNRLKSDLPGSYQLYLSNHWGDFLIHPSATETFGFDLGRRIFIQESFPPVSVLIKGATASSVTNIEEKTSLREGLVTAFIRLPFGGSVKMNFVVLGLSQPLDTILLETDDLGKNTLKMILALGALAVGLAALVSRAVTGPLRQMVDAVSLFSKEHVVSKLPLGRRDEIGLLAHSLNEMQVTIVTTMSELQQSRQTLRHLSQHDSLTSLPNRVLFDDRLRQALALSQRERTRMALLFVDLDKFKMINDTHGHHIGDLLLQTVATRMVACVRSADTVGRLSGDEFVVLLPHVEMYADAMVVAEKICHALALPFDLDGRSLLVSASIGVAIYPDHGENALSLTKSADAAMYRAKQAGGNCAEIFS
jgi:diguanylate cyclase (GGDEF)-like protein